ncbi:MAG: hypothetical protein KIT80_22925 [Chitinophagaceae bacterium]|nr:hypothetical protein [Chitinophagaceae bacterium]
MATATKITRIPPKAPLPYQNKSLADIKGEIWKEIPGLDGCYLVSNFGRVKALPRFVINSNAYKGYWTKERIMAQTVSSVRINRHTKQLVRFLNIIIRYENHSFPFTVARLVYNLFIEEINLDKAEVFIKYKDGNGLNCQSSNLLKATRGENIKICYEKGQIVAPYLEDPSRFKNFIASVVQGKPVCQYNNKGMLLKTYKSQKAASAETGISDSVINSALKKKIKTAGGYIWRYQGERFGTKKEQKEIAMHNGKKKIVTQYDMKGNKIAVYSSLRDAEHATGADLNQILRSTKFKHLSAKGSFWRAGEGTEKIDVTFYWNRINKNLKSISYAVEQYSNGKKINTYPSLRAAMRQTGINSTVIARAIKQKKKTKGDFMWRMKK